MYVCMYTGVLRSEEALSVEVVLLDTNAIVCTVCNGAFIKTECHGVLKCTSDDYITQGSSFLRKMEFPPWCSCVL